MNEQEVKRSRAYHQFFEGYTEVIEENPKSGRQIIRRIYTEDFYQRNGTEKRNFAHKISIFLIFLCVGFCFMRAAWYDYELNYFWGIALMEAILLILLTRLAIAVGANLLAPRKMQIRIYRNIHEKLPKRSLAASVFLLATSIFCFIYIRAGKLDAINLKESLWFAVGGALCLIPYFWERKEQYLKVKNPLKESVKGAFIY